MRLWIKSEVARLTNIRASQNRGKGVPGPEGATGKLAFAENNMEIREFNMELLGPRGMLYNADATEHSAAGADGPGSAQQHFLRSRANSIEGGTSEVMRNILGERVLGLPGDVRIDKDRPFTEVPSS
jgi:alkylation response protein AidB-like acyl-CoA dehydrogenase